MKLDGMLVVCHGNSLIDLGRRGGSFSVVHLVRDRHFGWRVLRNDCHRHRLLANHPDLSVNAVEHGKAEQAAEHRSSAVAILA